LLAHRFSGRVDRSSGGAVVKNTKIIDLGQVRDLFAEWEKVRQHLATMHVKGFQIALVGPDDKETVYTGGVYKEDPLRALSATLKLSAARALADDPPLALKSKG
jgi:hypothetical protein